MTRLTTTVLLLLLVTGQAVAQRPAPLFSGTDIQSGQTVSLTDYRGRVVFVDFWASWCPPCLVSLPAYDRMLAQIGTDDFAIIAINVDEKTENGLLFLQDTTVSYPVIADPEGEIGIPYGIRSLPVSFLLDQAGNIVASYRSYQPGDENTIARAVQALLTDPPQ